MQQQIDNLAAMLDELNHEIKIDKALIDGDALSREGVFLIRNDMLKLQRKASNVKRKIHAKLKAVR